MPRTKSSSQENNWSNFTFLFYANQLRSLLSFLIEKLSLVSDGSGNSNNSDNYFPIKINGFANIPKQGPVIILFTDQNYLNYYIHFLLQFVYSERRLTFLANEDRSSLAEKLEYFLFDEASPFKLSSFPYLEGTMGFIKTNITSVSVWLEKQLLELGLQNLEADFWRAYSVAHSETLNVGFEKLYSKTNDKLKSQSCELSKYISYLEKNLRKLLEKDCLLSTFINLDITSTSTKPSTIEYYLDKIENIENIINPKAEVLFFKKEKQNNYITLVLIKLARQLQIPIVSASFTHISNTSDTSTSFDKRDIANKSKIWEYLLLSIISEEKINTSISYNITPLSVTEDLVSL